MDKPNPLAGTLILAFSLLGGWYVARALLRALSNGFSPGKLGAIHQAGSIQYYAFVAACGIGIGLMTLLALLGLRWLGLIDAPQR